MTRTNSLVVLVLFLGACGSGTGDAVTPADSSPGLTGGERPAWQEDQNDGARPEIEESEVAVGDRETNAGPRESDNPAAATPEPADDTADLPEEEVDDGTAAASQAPEEEDAEEDDSPEIVPQGVGACTNAADEAVLDAMDPAEEAKNCGFQCFMDPNKDACAEQCMSENTDLSEPCIECFLGVLGCVMDHCVIQCAANPGSPDCIGCREAAGCNDTFEACSGLAAD